MPKLTDVVRVIQTKEQAPGLWRLQDVWESPAKYWYNGFLFELVRLDERHTRSKYLGIVAGKVVKTMSHHEPKTTLKSTVVYADGSQGEFRSTPDHRFYVPSLDEYVGMQGVPEGEEFETADGQRALLLRKDVESISQEYFNLTVADAHNYYVMPGMEDANFCEMWDPDKAVLVHNDNCPTGLLGTDQITDPRRLLAHDPSVPANLHPGQTGLPPVTSVGSRVHPGRRLPSASSGPSNRMIMLSKDQIMALPGSRWNGNFALDPPGVERSVLRSAALDGGSQRKMSPAGKAMNKHTNPNRKTTDQAQRDVWLGKSIDPNAKHSPKNDINNARAEAFMDELMDSPTAVWQPYDHGHKNWGPAIRGRLPDGRSAVWSQEADGWMFRAFHFTPSQ